MIYNYIAIEGNIGAGKTSLAIKISEEYNAKLILEEFEDNSFLPKFYKDPEKFAFPLELSFLANRYHQLKNSLTHQDLFKSFTVSDYFFNKSIIFARKTLPDDEFGLYSRLFEIINASLPKPNLLIYLYVDISRLLANIKKRGRVYEQNIDSAYLQRIQYGYLEYIKQLQGITILIIDANKIDFVNNLNDYITLKKVINNKFEVGIHRITL